MQHVGRLRSATEYVAEEKRLSSFPGSFFFSRVPLFYLVSYWLHHQSIKRPLRLGNLLIRSHHVLGNYSSGRLSYS